ncbi:unnamed protein product [Lepeophtheirus salmonis]|uniref:(salmon louse) hypothetical protein n=1 Tax=Lepeophtheirus salmonis TaxID=72036 RepID=A0A0K2U535_LEPSM|nr:unnamed protein product [Lepeophtheirus salmonis]CAF2807492.1 unnamed protein product [Lepeophtheirus salmonis]
MEANSIMISRFLTFSLVIFLSLSSFLQISESRFIENPQSNPERETLPDPLKYLEELEQIYSQYDRPKERRVGNNMASALKKLSQIKDFYNEAGRPRFGKRSGRAYELPLISY